MKFYRFTETTNPMSNWGHAMFAKDAQSVENYGQYCWTIDKKECVTLKSIKSLIIKAWKYDVKNGFSGDFAGNTTSDDYYYNLSAEDLYNSFNPSDIVDCADGYDSETSQWLYERVIEPNNIKAVYFTQGAVVYNNDDNIIKSEKYDVE